MNTVWQSLLWKEWHESRWKLASLTAILFAVPLCMSWGYPESFPQTAFGISVWYSLLAPIYIAAGVCASEASGNTLLFLQATPVDRKKWAFAKLAMGWFTVTTPLLLLLSFGVIRDVIDPGTFGSGFRGALKDNTFLGEPPPYFGQVSWVAMRAIVAPASMFIWTLAVGVNCRKELWVIARSMGGLVGLCIFLGVGAHFLGIRAAFAQAILPGGFLVGYASANLPVLLVAIIFYGGLFAWYLTQFGRSIRHAGHSPKAVVIRDSAAGTICEPHKSKTSAILWMQMQEIAPLAAACLALILLPALSISYWATSLHGIPYAERLGNALVGMICMMGFSFSIMIGVGVFLRDLEPGLNAFWRSRPIPTSHWFWTKFLSAYAMLAVAIGIPGALAGTLFSPTPLQAVILVAGLLTLAYTAAVAVTALVRHAIYGCLLSMGIVLIPFVLTNKMFVDHGSNETFYLSHGVLCAFLIAVTTLIAWLAVTRDWGWKR